MTKTLILLNGPKGSGKDYAAEFLMKEFAAEEPVHMKFSQPLKNLVCDQYNLTPQELEAKKDLATTTSFRDFQIALYMSIAKIFGEDWLGKALITRINRLQNDLIILSDCGRNAELVPLIRYFGPDNILLLHIYRKGHTFDGDIRNYVHDPRVSTALISNDGTKNFHTELLNEVYPFLTGETT